MSDEKVNDTSAQQKRALESTQSALKQALAHIGRLRDAMHAVIDNPYGCPMCDAGKLRRAHKPHWPDCPYTQAQAALDALKNEVAS